MHCCKIAWQARRNTLTPRLPSMRRTDLCFWRSAGSVSCPSVLRRSLWLRTWGPVTPCRPWCAPWYPTSRGSSTTTTSFLKSIQSWLRTTLERKSSVFTSDRSVWKPEGMVCLEGMLVRLCSGRRSFQQQELCPCCLFHLSPFGSCESNSLTCECKANALNLILSLNFDFAPYLIKAGTHNAVMAGIVFC